MPGTADGGTGRDSAPALDARLDDASGDAGGTTLTWSRCRGFFECTTLEVPTHHDDPGSTPIQLHVIRRPASNAAERIGTLVINVGGPTPATHHVSGELPAWATWGLADRFDLVGFDLRGLGESTPGIDCVDAARIDRLRAEIDLTPDDAADRARLDEYATDMAAACRMAHGDDFLSSIHTDNAARDLELLRVALGEERLHFFSVSYGTLLAAAYATLHPDRVGAFVLDSPLAPDHDGLVMMARRAAAFEVSLERFFAWCAAATDASCPIRGDGALTTVRANYDALAARFESGPVAAGMRSAHVADFHIAVMVGAAFDREGIAGAMAEAAAGDATTLLAYADADVRAANILEFEHAIVGLDYPLAASFDATAYQEWLSANVPADARLAGAAAGRTGLRLHWPVARDSSHLAIGHTSLRMLILAGRYDPLTTLDDAMAMAAAFPASELRVLDLEGHSQAFHDRCARELAVAFLLDPTTPPTGPSCP